MQKFRQLCVHEMNRAKKFYLSVIATVFSVELIFIIWQVIRYIEERHHLELYKDMPKLNVGYILSHSMVFAMVVGAAIAAMKLYAFYTWIREWRFQGNFIYRLLLLPGKRVTIAYAKLASLMLMIFGLLALQVVFTHAMNLGLQSFVGVNPMQNLDMVTMWSVFDILFLPKNFYVFVLFYATWFGVLAWITNLVVGFFSLQAKSFATMIGSLIGYSVLSILLMGAFFKLGINLILIENEVYFYMTAFVIVWLAWHLSIMHYLMKRRISI